MIRRQFSFILLLAASLLLLQSLAIWHDVEHPYHEHVAECDRLNLISQQPIAEISTSINLVLHTTYIITATSAVIADVRHDIYALPSIRGPPIDL